MKKISLRFLSVLMGAALMLGSPVSAGAASRAGGDFSAIVRDSILEVPQTLQVASPAEKNTNTTASTYYVCGTSDPNARLYLNGMEITNRGRYGSFGVDVALNMGSNVLQFEQSNGARQIITITRGAQSVVTSDSISAAYPTYDSAYESGSSIKLTCTAPSGAEVYASVGGTKVRLTQQAATAYAGVPAKYAAELPVGQSSALTNIGPVKYSMTFNGKSKSLSSTGNILVYPQGSTLLVQVKEVSASVFTNGTTTNEFITTAKYGAIEAVVGQNENRYQLAMGGWVSKEVVQPLVLGSPQNTFSGISQNLYSGMERYGFKGTSHPLAAVWVQDNLLCVQFYHTTGLSSFGIERSQFFSGATVYQNGDSTVAAFQLLPGADLYGYGIEYSNGTTYLYVRSKPQIDPDSSTPLSGITIYLDAGHGGSDPGALGTSRNYGPAEKDITYASCLAIKKRLESLGATVMFREANIPQNTKYSFFQRMFPPLQQKADLFLSIHCNSVAGSGTKANGVEVYYYEQNSKTFAQIIDKYIAGYTNRTDRGAKWSNYRVTLSSMFPAILCEIGFLTNPVEYDSLCSPEGIYNLANAIGDGIVAYFS